MTREEWKEGSQVLNLVPSWASLPPAEGEDTVGRRSGGEVVDMAQECNYNVITHISRRWPVRARIVKIGNSRGVRIPKPLLEQTGISDDVELEAGDGQIVIRAISHPRSGWDSAFEAMHEAGDDTIIDSSDSISHSWDDSEWQW